MRGITPERTSRPLMLAAVGVVAGFIAGLFGVGGGIFITPGLVLLGGYPQRLAHGTSLATSAVFAAAGLAAYALQAAVDVLAALAIFGGSSVGVLLGADLLNRARIRTLQGAFVVLLAVTAARMPAGVGEGSGDLTLTAATVLGLLGCGVLAGLVAGLLGVGGGVVVVPALILVFEMSTVTAKGTSLAVVLPTAAVGTWRNWRNDNVDLRGAMVTGAGGVASAFGGGLLAGVIDPSVAAALFAGLLILVALRMIRDILSRRGRLEGAEGSGIDPDL